MRESTLTLINYIMILALLVTLALHLAMQAFLGVAGYADALSYQTALARGLHSSEKPKIGRDGKWQLSLYDPNLTRVELMEPKPVEKPCCSPILD